MFAAKTISCFALYYLFFNFVNSLQALPFIFTFFILFHLLIFFLFLHCPCAKFNLCKFVTVDVVRAYITAGIVLLFAFRVVSFCEMAGCCSFSATKVVSAEVVEDIQNV